MRNAVHVHRDQVIKRLRQEGWRFKRQTERIELYKKPGSRSRVDIPKRDLLHELSVRAICKQAGLTPPQIDEFLRICTKG